jgi:hypothetical protein
MGHSTSIQTTFRFRGVITWNLFFVVLYLYRSTFSVLGDYVMQFTSIGDTESFQNSEINAIAEKYVDQNPLGALTSLKSFETSTYLTDWVGAQFHAMFGGSTILINVGYQTIAFVGIIYLLLSVPPSARKVLAALLMLPSFTFWTSIASKESIVSSCVAIITGYLVRQYYRNTSLSLIHLLAGMVLYIYKPHYLIAFSYAWAAKNVGGYVRQRALAAYIGFLLSLVGLVLFSEEIVDLSFHVQWSFETVADVRSTRLEPFFIDKYDVFWKFPEGFYLAFVGPTIDEISKTPLHIITFIESMVLLAAIALAILRRIKKIPVYSFIVGIGTTFWLLFPNYPFGVMNPGSAIRYRSGWIILLFVTITVLMSREMFLAWKGNPPEN